MLVLVLVLVPVPATGSTGGGTFHLRDHATHANRSLTQPFTDLTVH